MILPLVNLAITAMLVVTCASPASAFCLARDLTKPGGWDWDRSVGRRTFPIDDEFDRSFIVGTVKVVAVLELHEDKDDPEGVTAHTYRVELVRQLKGPATSEFTLYNQNSSARFDMEVGKEYLAFVQKVGKHSIIDSCGWSDELDLAVTTLSEALRLVGTKPR